MTWQVVTLVCVALGVLLAAFMVVWNTFFPVPTDPEVDPRIEPLMDAYHNFNLEIERNRANIAKIEGRLDTIETKQPPYAPIPWNQPTITFDDNSLGANGPDLAQYPRITEPMDPYDAYIPTFNGDWTPQGDDDVRGE